jgi:hypothetical protein
VDGQVAGDLASTHSGSGQHHLAQAELAKQGVKVGGQGVEVVSGAGPAGGAEAAAVVGDHPVAGGEQGGFLFFPRVPVQRVPVDQHDRGTGPVVFVVDPDSG